MYKPAEYWQQRLSQGVDLRHVGMLGVTSSYNRWLYRRRERVFLDVVKTHLPLDSSQLRVLELGSGSGFYVRLWKLLGCSQLVGIDIADASVTALKRAFPCYCFHRANIADDLTSALGGDTFDVVTAFDVLFHIVDEEAFRRTLCNVAARLRPAGTFLFSDRFVERACTTVEHVKHRRFRDVENVLRRLGLRVVRRVPVFRVMVPPAEPRRTTFPYRCLLRLVGSSEILGFVFGFVLYCCEGALARSFGRPSSRHEIVLVQKASAGAPAEQPQ